MHSKDDETVKKWISRLNSWFDERIIYPLSLPCEDLKMEIISHLSIDRKIIAGSAAAGFVGAAYVIDYLDERRKQTPVWEYEARPPHILDWDKLVRVASNPLMKLVAGGMISHHWDWVQVPIKDEYEGVWLPPSKNPIVQNFERGDFTLLHHMLAHSVVWQEAYALGLDRSKLNTEWFGIQGFHYGWHLAEFGSVVRSRILIPREEQIKILIGAKSPRVMALDSDNNELPLLVEGPFDRRDPQYRHLRQF